MLRLTIDLAIVIPENTGADPVLEFASANIGDAEEITFEVVYVGHEGTPDVVTVTAEGEIVHASAT